jgi:hypothetical protein
VPLKYVAVDEGEVKKWTKRRKRKKKREWRKKRRKMNQPSHSPQGDTRSLNVAG